MMSFNWLRKLINVPSKSSCALHQMFATFCPKNR